MKNKLILAAGLCIASTGCQRHPDTIRHHIMDPDKYVDDNRHDYHDEELKEIYAENDEVIALQKQIEGKIDSETSPKD
ncbi:hypothetical protein GF340_02740 [Candidatus Peregrinibacteria bacterium]|nr:hypothetical protein [Candidatus Peregrinibacteria bacterium]